MNLKFIFAFFWAFSLASMASANPLSKILLRDLTISSVYSEEPSSFILEMKIKPSQLPQLSSMESDGNVSETLYSIRGSRIFLGFGVSRDQMNNYAKTISKTSKWFPYSLWIPRSEAACPVDGSSLTMNDLTLNINQLSVNEAAKSCDFSLKEIIQKKVTEAKETLEAIEGFNLSDFIVSVKQSIQGLKELAPHFNEKVIVPLNQLAQQAPRFAHFLMCSFMENKIGDMMMAAALPGGVFRITTKTLHDILGFSEKIKHLTGNRKFVLLLIDLEKRGLLTPEVMKKLMNVTNDFDSNVKRSISNQFYGFRNQEKMMEHAMKHAKEMGFKTTDEYLTAAHNFVKRTDSNSLASTLSDGGHVKWNTRTNEVAILTRDGKIQSYYKKTCESESDMLLYLVSTHSNMIQNGICR